MGSAVVEVVVGSGPPLLCPRGVRQRRPRPGSGSGYTEPGTLTEAAAAAAAAAAAGLGRSLHCILQHWLSICSLLANDIVFAGCFEPPVIYAYLASRTVDSFLCNISHYTNGLN